MNWQPHPKIKDCLYVPAIEDLRVKLRIHKRGCDGYTWSLQAGGQEVERSRPRNTLQGAQDGAMVAFFTWIRALEEAATV